MEYRIEHDSMGEVKVPADVLWAAQTQRSHENFEIGVGIETMPAEIVHAFGVLKKAAAITNNALKPEKMTDEKLAAIKEACDEVMEGKLLAHFPLVVWQTGSGTQSNMNANEVIANRGNQHLPGTEDSHNQDPLGGAALTSQHSSAQRGGSLASWTRAVALCRGPDSMAGRETTLGGGHRGES